MDADYEWFVNSDLSEFDGKWIAILNKQVIASEKDAKRLVEELKLKYPGSKPLITKISNQTLIL